MEEITAKGLNALGHESSFATMQYQLTEPQKLPQKLAVTVKHLWLGLDVNMVTTGHTACLSHLLQR